MAEIDSSLSLAWVWDTSDCCVGLIDAVSPTRRRKRSFNCSPPKTMNQQLQAQGNAIVHVEISHILAPPLRDSICSDLNF